MILKLLLTLMILGGYYSIPNYDEYIQSLGDHSSKVLMLYKDKQISTSETIKYHLVMTKYRYQETIKWLGNEIEKATEKVGTTLNKMIILALIVSFSIFLIYKIIKERRRTQIYNKFKHL